MADFLIAYRLTKQSEGVYSNDVGDSGGETVWGITRNTDAEWDGWKIVDTFKKQATFLNNLRTSIPLDNSLQAFYKKKYWMPMRGDELLIQSLANSIYDSCVNVGVGQGIKFSQRSVGNPDTGHMDDLTVNKLNNKA